MQFKHGRRKLKKEFDVCTLVKQFQQVRLMSNIMFEEHQKKLMKYSLDYLIQCKGGKYKNCWEYLGEQFDKYKMEIDQQEPVQLSNLLKRHQKELTTKDF